MLSTRGRAPATSPTSSSTPSSTTRARRIAVAQWFGAAALLVTAITLISQPALAAATGYQPLPAPERLVDTRAGQSTVDGAFAAIGERAADSTLAIDVAGRAGLGDDPGSVVLNLTVDQPGGAGFLTIWPCDQPRPTASNLNYVAGQTVAVAALSKVAPDGTVCLYTLARTQLIVDVGGAFPPGSLLPLDAPQRIADTREGEQTIDGRSAGDGLRPRDHTTTIEVAGRGAVPDDATAVVLNVTATTVSEPGFLTVFPCDAQRPTASNVNYDPGFTTPNVVMTRLDADGNVCIYTLAPVDIIVDIAGSLPDDVFLPVPEPRRLLDTRVGEPTFDGLFTGGGRQPDGSTLQLDVAGRSGIPAGATAVVLNVTSTASTAPGFVTAHPQGSSLPGSSNVNYFGGRTVANLVIAALGPTGDVCLFNRGPTHIVVDVAGWLTGPPPAGTAASCPGREAPETAETYRSELVRRPAMHRVVGHDTIAVHVCDIPVGSTGFSSPDRHDVTDTDFASFANAEVAPYFAAVSNGAYSVEFVANGTLQADSDDGPGDCVERAFDATGPSFSNTFVADSTLTGGGFASPGTIFFGSGAPDFDVFDRSASNARRGGWLGGAVISLRPNPATIIHEIGHTIHWPHSFVGPDFEYDNPVDVMSDGVGRCQIGNTIYFCDPGSTLAFNRFAAGWLQNGDVITHPSGTVNYLLDRPTSSGLELIVAPDPDEPLSALTLETRVAVGDDDFLDIEGVALHLTDQVNRNGGLSGLSSSRFTRQARGAGGTYDHVLEVGETATIHGLTVTVLRRADDAFEVSVSGSYEAPGSAFFTEAVESDWATCATAGTLEQPAIATCLR